MRVSGDLGTTTPALNTFTTYYAHSVSSANEFKLYTVKGNTITGAAPSGLVDITAPPSGTLYITNAGTFTLTLAGESTAAMTWGATGATSTQVLVSCPPVQISSPFEAHAPSPHEVTVTT